MVETHSVFAIPYRVLYLGVAAVIGLEGEMISLPVGDEAMVGVIKERFVLRPRGGPDPSYDQAQRLAALEGRIGYLGHVGAAIGASTVSDQSSSAISSICRRRPECWRTVTEKRTSSFLQAPIRRRL